MDVVIQSMENYPRGLVVVVRGGAEWPLKGHATFRDASGAERACTVSSAGGFTNSSNFGLLIHGVDAADFVIGSTMQVQASGYYFDALTMTRRPISELPTGHQRRPEVL